MTCSQPAAAGGGTAIDTHTKIQEILPQPLVLWARAISWVQPTAQRNTYTVGGRRRMSQSTKWTVQLQFWQLMQRGPHVRCKTLEYFYNTGLYNGCILHLLLYFIVQDKMHYDSLRNKHYLCDFCWFQYMNMVNINIKMWLIKTEITYEYTANISNV